MVPLGRADRTSTRSENQKWAASETLGCSKGESKTRADWLAYLARLEKIELFASVAPDVVKIRIH